MRADRRDDYYHEEPEKEYRVDDSEPSELETLLQPMDLPVNKKNGRPQTVRWLLRNIGFRNASHPNYARALELLVAEARKEHLLDKSKLRNLNGKDQEEIPGAQA